MTIETGAISNLEKLKIEIVSKKCKKRECFLYFFGEGLGLVDKRQEGAEEKANRGESYYAHKENRVCRRNQIN